MDKKYYSVKYGEDLNIGELKIIGTACRGQYEPSVSKLVRNYKDEFYDGLDFVFFGLIEKSVRCVKQVPADYFELYVEEVDGKYYDIITGEEVTRVNEIVVDYRKYYPENIKDYEEMDSDYNMNILKSGKLAAEMFPVEEREVYDFVRTLAKSDIELYIQRFKTLQENAKKLGDQRLEDIAKHYEEKNREQMEQRKFMDEFSKEYGYQRKKKF